MQRVQISIIWLQTTEVSFTSVLATEVKIFLIPSGIIPTPPIINFWESFQPLRSFQTPRLFGILE